MMNYNMPAGVWLWGAEADFPLTNMNSATACLTGGGCENKNTWLAMARAGLGYAGWSNFAPYLSGGYAMRPEWRAKADYLYAALGALDCGLACGTVEDRAKVKTNIVRAGYRF